MTLKKLNMLKIVIYILLVLSFIASVWIHYNVFFIDIILFSILIIIDVYSKKLNKCQEET